MSEYAELPWSVGDTIENLKEIKYIMKKKVLLQNLHGRGKKDAEEIDFDFNRAINALEEIQKYRNIGVMDPDELEQDLLLYKADRELVQLYSGIGTVEECRAAVEKQNKIVEQIETKILGKVCIGCGYLKDNICTYKGSNCGVSNPMYKDIKKVFEEMKGGGLDE